LNIKDRIISILFYTGFILFFPSLLLKKNQNDELINAYSNALAVSFVQSITFIMTLLIWIFGYYAVAQYAPRSLEILRIGNIFILGYIALAVLLIGITLWLIYLIGIIFQRPISIPLITKIARHKSALRLSYLINLVFVIFLCFIVFSLICSNKMARDPQKPAKVYMLYDDMGFVPNWVFPLGFYQIQRAAAEKWGDGHVSIEPITNASIKEAIQHATMIFLSVHGNWSEGEFAGMFHFANQARDKLYGYGPDQIKEIGIGKNLKFVYLAQCNGGVLHKEWAQAFSPAKIKSFDRTSLYPEHIYWLWFKLPGLLRNNF
jgi:hypothetical protein